MLVGFAHPHWEAGVFFELGAWESSTMPVVCTAGDRLRSRRLSVSQHTGELGGCGTLAGLVPCSTGMGYITRFVFTIFVDSNSRFDTTGSYAIPSVYSEC